MNQATIVTRKDARTLARLHSALADMLAGMDGLLTRKRKRAPSMRRKRPTARETAPTAPAARAPKAAALARAKATAARIAANINEG